MSTTSPLKIVDNPEHIKRIEALELELKRANEMTAVYQRKWDKLKETAKKKRESRGSNSELMISTSPMPSAASELTPVPSDLPPKSPKSANSHSSQQTARPISPSSTQSMYFSVNSVAHSRRFS
jgi:hypothetical protein